MGYIIGRMTERKIKNNNTANSMRKLPEFRGYTVDARLRQFRKADPSKQSIEFLDFDTEQGDLLLGEYINTLDKNSAEFRAIVQHAFTRG